MKTINLPPQQLQAHFAAAEADRDNRTVPVTFYTGTEVLQFSWERGEYNLTLSLEPGHVRLGRFRSGRAPFTRGHASANDPLATLGVITNPRIENGKAKADVRFSKRADVDPIFADVLDGILPNVSVGANLYKLEETTQEKDERKSFLATDWEPTAVALVGSGADPDAHFAAAEQNVECEIEFAARASAREGVNMENESTGAVIAGTNNDAEAIRKVAAVCKLAAYGEDLIGRNLGINEARAALIDKMATESNQHGEIRTHHGEITRDGQDTMQRGMLEALMARAQRKPPSEIARPWFGRRLPDFARELLRARGEQAWGSDGHVVDVALSLTTSDFPGLLSNFANKVALAAYGAVPSGIRVVCRQSTAADFKMQYKLRRGEFPALLAVPESAEVKSGPILEAKESYKIGTYGRIVGLSRQAIINDDLGVFTTLTGDAGRAAADFEAQFLTDLLTANAGAGPTMDDNYSLFDETYHHNLAGSGAGISIDTLSAARVAMRSQKGIDEVSLVDAAPRYLLVPVAQQTLGESYLAKLSPTVATDVNPFEGRLELAVEPRLDAVSADRWYCFSDAVPCLEFAYLESEPGPQVVTRVGFEVLGIQVRITLDFGGAAIDWRGGYANDGK